MLTLLMPTALSSRSISMMRSTIRKGKRCGSSFITRCVSAVPSFFEEPDSVIALPAPNVGFSPHYT
jgi:hypothetical protein